MLLLQHHAVFAAAICAAAMECGAKVILLKRKEGHRNLSRRERQIMDILYQRGRATASEVHERLADAPSYSAVRAKLRVLEEKGYVRHEEKALRYVYLPTLARET